MYVNVRALIEKDVNGKRHILVQKRTKHNQECIELPGGRLEEYESLLDGLKREVLEETGLTLSHIEGAETLVTTDRGDTDVECIRPFAVYQTIKGPVDSMGVYFRCKADGEPLQQGDDTDEIRWISVEEVLRLITDYSDKVSWVDHAGMRFYVNSLKGE